MPTRPQHRACADPTCRQTFTATSPRQIRCPRHEPAHQQQQALAKRARRAERSSAERQRRAAAIDDHVEAHGWWCPGWASRPPHPSNDLTADHVIPVAAGGPEDGPLVVRCRPCNSARGTKGIAG